MLRVNLASQAVTAGVAVLINPLRHPIPIILGHDARQSASSPRVTQAFVKEIHAHPMEWLGEPDLRFRVEGGIWDFLHFVLLRSN